MAVRSGSFCRSVISSVRGSSLRSVPRLHSPPLAARPRLHSRRHSFSTARNLGELGCTQSLLPMNRVMGAATSHLCVSVRAFCELYHGTFCRTCQDR